jgi:hypothetical protein
MSAPSLLEEHHLAHICATTPLAFSAMYSTSCTGSPIIDEKINEKHQDALTENL